MKKTYFTLFNIFYFFILNSQNVDQPTFCCLYVGSDNYVRLNWFLNDTSTISGFIVKRIIYDGNGVVEGTLNNIEILGKTFSYIDSSKTYQTTSKPHLRSETYAVSAYKIVGNEVFYSPMTNLLKTVFLSYIYDSCSSALTLKWTKYINANVINYEILYGTSLDSMSKLATNEASDTVFISKDIEKNKNLFFVVKVNFEKQPGCQCRSSFSNVVNIYSKSSVLPQNLENIYTSVLDNNTVEISYLVENFQNIKEFRLYKENLFLAIVDSNTFEFKDNTLTTQNNCYFLGVVDLCNQEIFKSKTTCSSVLECKNVENSLVLNWNEIPIFESTPDIYTIEIEINGKWFDFKTISGYTTSITIETIELLQYIIESQEQIIKVRIKASKYEKYSYSSIAEVFIEPILLIPEAINPYSEIEENRYFTIKSLFVKSLQITIYTRNGAIIFKSNDFQSFWDCRYKNQIVEPNAYIYSIEYSDNNGKKYKRKGTINVIY